jgi:chorismate mutase
MTNISDLRDSIENLDNQLLNLIKQRNELTKQVAYYKSLNDIEVINQEIYETKKSNFIKFAISNGLEEEYLSDLWELIHDNSVLTQTIHYH